ncbi:MAG TPA: hypothetical protein VMR44_02880 [Thermoanaerobaculia bacterium]|nr:hypothetical protein [Thermoanaerobaculia bacterium]
MIQRPTIPSVPVLLAALALVLAAILAGTAPAAAVTDGASPEAAPGAAETSAHGEEKEGPELPAGAELVEHDRRVFKPDPTYAHEPYDPAAQLAIYGDKHLNRTARPLLELGRPLYREGPLEPAKAWFGAKNPASPHLMVYGDLRTAAAYNDFGAADASGKSYQATVATRLNLELDFKLTATERLHLFVRPTERDGRFTRYDISGRNEGFEEELDLDLDTLFFEGEVGPIFRGMSGRENQIDLPFAVGLFPLFTQNGVWTEDAVTGGAFTIPAFSSNALGASNIDLTFFAAFDEVTTAAVTRADGTLADTADLFGVAGFVEANEGFWELGYGFVDAGLDELDYHNLTVAFSRRYGGRVANSVRLIANLGQEPVPGREKTADGALVLVESYLMTSRPYTLVPYLNLFAGFDRPQALVRAADAGGVLKNTGINFETDGLTGYPKLDDRAHDAFGGALGVQYLFALDQQIVIEGAVVQRIGGGVTEALGDEYALGIRWQKPVTNAWIVRADAMHGWLADRENLYGVRVELRRKF